MENSPAPNAVKRPDPPPNPPFPKWIIASNDPDYQKGVLVANGASLAFYNPADLSEAIIQLLGEHYACLVQEELDSKLFD